MKQVTSPFWDKTITIFTKYIDEVTKAVRWYRYVVRGCFFGRVSAARFASPALYRESENVVRIPSAADFVCYPVWCTLPDEEKAYHMTIAPEKSLVFLGEVEGEITDGRGTALRGEYPDSFSVKSFRDNTAFALSHYFVGG